MGSLDFIANIITIVTGIMAILGVRGILEWKKKQENKAKPKTPPPPTPPVREEVVPEQDVAKKVAIEEKEPTPTPEAAPKFVIAPEAELAFSNTHKPINYKSNFVYAIFMGLLFSAINIIIMLLTPIEAQVKFSYSFIGWAFIMIYLIVTVNRVSRVKTKNNGIGFWGAFKVSFLVLFVIFFLVNLLGIIAIEVFRPEFYEEFIHHQAEIQAKEYGLSADEFVEQMKGFYDNKILLFFWPLLFYGLIYILFSLIIALIMKSKRR